MVGYLAHPSCHPERNNKPETQIASLSESYDAFLRRHLQKYHIPDLKLQLRSMSVGVSLRATLGCLKSLPNLLNKLCCLDHYLYAPHDSLAYLSLTNRGPTRSPIEELKGWPPNAGVIVIVI